MAGRQIDLGGAGPLPGRLSRDADDNIFVACALAGRASHVIAQDRDLLNLSKPKIVAELPARLVKLPGMDIQITGRCDGGARFVRQSALCHTRGQRADADRSGASRVRPQAAVANQTSYGVR
jgi:hypothetical protein